MGEVIGPDTIAYNRDDTGILFAYTVATPLLAHVLVVVATESIVTDAIVFVPDNNANKTPTLNFRLNFITQGINKHEQLQVNQKKFKSLYRS
jgi:hypothetical protein